MLHQKERNRPRRSNCLNALHFNGIGQTSKSRLLLQMRLAVISCRILSVPKSFLDAVSEKEFNEFLGVSIIFRSAARALMLQRIAHCTDPNQFVEPNFLYSSHV